MRGGCLCASAALREIKRDRADAIKDDNSGTPGTALATYSYNGTGMIVAEDCNTPGVKLDLYGGIGGTYGRMPCWGIVAGVAWDILSWADPTGAIDLVDSLSD